MDENAEQIINQIIEETDAERKEIIEKVEAKREELSGFITPEGAATIVARSYGVTPERTEPEVRKLLINDLSEGMSNVDIVGRVSRTFEPKEFERKDGSVGRVANIMLMDRTGEIRVVLWDKMTKYITESEIIKGTVVRLKRAYIKSGFDDSPELNIGLRGEIEIDPEDERVEDLPSVNETFKKISDLDTKFKYVDVIGRIISISEPRQFERDDGSTGKVATMRIMDETGQIRVSLWGEMTERIEEIEQGTAIKLENASIREGWKGATELHMNWRGRINENLREEEIANLPEFEKKLLKVEEVEPNMTVLDIAARVKRIYTPRNFSRDDGSEGQVMNILLSDETGSIRASLWNEMVEVGDRLSPGDIVLLENASSGVGLQKRPEIRIGKRTKIEINPEDIEIEEVEPSKFRVSELEAGLDSIEIAGRITSISEITEFTRSNDTEGKGASLQIGDQTGTARVALWDSQTEAINELKKGDTIVIKGANTTSGNYGDVEVHANEEAVIEKRSNLEEELPQLSEIKTSTPEAESASIGDITEGSQVKLSGTVVRVFQRKPVFFVCPKCGQKLIVDDSDTLCEKCKEIVKPEPRTVINTILDDGTGNIRVVAFGKTGEKMFGKTADEIQEKISDEAELSSFYSSLELPGKEITITGGVKHDEYFDQPEVIARDIDFPDPKTKAEELIEKIRT